MNPSIQPAMTAGAMIGRVMTKKVFNGGQPRSIAASSRLRSKVTRRDCTTTVTKDSEKVMWARINVQKPRSKPIATKRSSIDRPVITSGMTSGA